MKQKTFTCRIKILFALLISFNLLIWIFSLSIFYHSTASLALCLMAYGFGIRHGLDADHITAIDSVTRKLVQENRYPMGIGSYFSLGHATVVIVLTFFVAIVTQSMRQHLPQLASFGALFGMVISATFLLLFSIINFIIFYDIVQKLRRSRQGREVSLKGHAKGLLSGLLKPLLKLITKSWQMYPVGFLFGLGFDTATEIALLGVAGYQVAQHVSIWAIMLFPLLFTAGMCLVDSTSGLLILGACRWACVNPKRKLYYNLVITAFSFSTALLVGGYELFQLMSSKFQFQQSTVNFISAVDNHFELIGIVIISLVALTWLIFSCPRWYARTVLRIDK